MNKVCALSFLVFFALISLGDRFGHKFGRGVKFNKKVYWLIPDGLRSDGEHLDLIKLVEKGYLPNVKKVLQSAIYRQSRPNFPNHSAVNFASIVTGAPPESHGIWDNHIGTLKERLAGEFEWGFDFTSLKQRPFWELYKERALLVLMPQTPVLGGENIHWIGDRFSSKIRRRKSFWIHFDSQNNLLKECEEKVARCQSSIFFASKIDRKNKGRVAYKVNTPIGRIEIERKKEKITFLLDNQEIVSSLGKASEWKANDFFIIPTHFDSNLLRVRVVLSQNPYLRSRAKESLLKDVLNHPILDFPGNNPSALEYTPSDDDVFLRELEESIQSHQHLGSKLATSLLKDYDLVMHSLYFPNMGLTRKWRNDTIQLNKNNRNGLPAKELIKVYQGVDRIVGKIIDHLPKDAALIISSDHGIEQAMVDFSVNDFLIKAGFLTLNEKETLGLDAIDWDKSEAVFFKSSRIYFLNKITEFRQNELVHKLQSLNFEGKSILQSLRKTQNYIDLTSMAGVRMLEDFLKDHSIFQSPSEVGGFKEALDPNLDSLRTPFIIYKKSIGELKRGKEITSDEQLKAALSDINGSSN